jgi:hypothetical protein
LATFAHPSDKRGQLHVLHEEAATITPNYATTTQHEHHTSTDMA